MLFMCAAAAAALSTCESQKGQVYTLNLINCITKRLMRGFRDSEVWQFNTRVYTNCGADLCTKSVC